MITAVRAAFVGPPSSCSVVTVAILLLLGSLSFSSLRLGSRPHAVKLGLHHLPNNNMSWIVERPRFILFGDSLTERSLGMGGWGSSLAHTYFRRVDVVNRGYGGYNTEWALLLMDDVFRGCSEKNTALVTLFWGANDAAIPLPDGTPHSARQHIPVATYASNLRRMVADLRARGLHNLLLITPPPVYEPGRRAAQKERMGAEAEDMPLDRTNAFTQQYAASCKEVAKDLGLPVVDLWTSMQDVKDWGNQLFNDGLHFTIEGNQHAYEAIQKAVNDTYPALRWDALPVQFPAWDAIDPTNPRVEFCHQA